MDNDVLTEQQADRLALCYDSLTEVERGFIGRPDKDYGYGRFAEAVQMAREAIFNVANSASSYCDSEQAARACRLMHQVQQSPGEVWEIVPDAPVSLERRSGKERRHRDLWKGELLPQHERRKETRRAIDRMRATPEEVNRLGNSSPKDRSVFDSAMDAARDPLTVELLSEGRIRITERASGLKAYGLASGEFQDGDEAVWKAWTKRVYATRASQQRQPVRMTLSGLAQLGYARLQART